MTIASKNANNAIIGHMFDNGDYYHTKHPAGRKQCYEVNHEHHNIPTTPAIYNQVSFLVTRFPCTGFPESEL